MKVVVKRISYQDLKQMALDVHNEYYESRAEKAGNFHIEIKMEDVPEDILQEWMIALIQDELVCVDETTGSVDDKIAVLNEMKSVYPELTTEIDRHLEIFKSRR